MGAKLARQYTTPLLIDKNRCSTESIFAVNADVSESIKESFLRDLVHEYPSCLPIAEIDNVFINPIPICTELRTVSGSIDNFMVTSSGLPVLVECKLWRNAEARRKVVAQILDYAKELSRWSSADIEREVRSRLRAGGNPLLERVRAAAPGVEEDEFNDALTANLRRGRFLLLIVGDGIREAVEAIAEYLQRHAGLHFSLGLVELPVFSLPDGKLLITPRLLVRTNVITRTVISAPDGYIIKNEDNTDEEEIEGDRDEQALRAEQQAFWEGFLEGLTLDDAEQPVPKPPRQGYIVFSLAPGGGSSWLTVYREFRQNVVGIFLSSTRGSIGEYANKVIAEDWDAIKVALGGNVTSTADKYGRPKISDVFRPGDLSEDQNRDNAYRWLRERVNTFVNVLRPRVRSAQADFQKSED